MMIRRESLTAVLAATTANDSRYYLNAVQAEPARNRLIATNGRVLLIATDRQPMDDADFPTIPGAAFHGDPSDPVLIPADIARSMIATMPKRGSLGILGAAQLSQNGSDTTSTLAATDLSAPRVATLRNDGETFPCYEKIVPSPDQPTRLILAVDVLEALVKAAKAVCDKGTTPIITFALTTGTDGQVPTAVHVSVAGTSVDLTGAVMPCRR